MQAFFIGINSKYIHTALGIRYVTEYCRARGCVAHRLEATVNEPALSVLTRVTERIEACVAKCNAEQADAGEASSASAVTIGSAAHRERVLIGMEVHIWNRQFVLELAELLRKVLPDCLLLLGGPEVMFHPAETLAAAPFVDVVICGEGEEVVADFLQRLSEYERATSSGTMFADSKKTLCGAGGSEAGARNVDAVFHGIDASALQSLIPYGMAYRDAQGKVVAPAAPVVVKNLDILPFPSLKG